MTGAFSPKVVAPGEGTTVKLFGVRFGYKVVSAGHPRASSSSSISP
jgi:hypothetical protein